MFHSFDRSFGPLSARRLVRAALRKSGWTVTRLVEEAPSRFTASAPTSLQDVRLASLAYARSLRLRTGREFGGHLYSASSRRPVLYATIAALLLKHLLDAVDDDCGEELAYVARFQGEDGLFRDPAIACVEADEEDWWGWRHLTSHALSTLALYDQPAKRRVAWIDRFLDENTLRRFLDGQDWGDRAAWTSNAVQNVGVMMQYARDYQGAAQADKALRLLFAYVDEKQDPATGLFGTHFDSPARRSNAVQAGYHFWLLYFYDERPVRCVERAIDSILGTQSLSGGFGVEWNSSACEDIDSLDPLARFARITNYRAEEVEAALQRGLAAVMRNLNPDGGWVFRTGEPFTYGFSRHMYSAANQSNIFFTWFRWLAVCLGLEGLRRVPAPWDMRPQWKRAPGHQFPVGAGWPVPDRSRTGEGAS